MVLSPLTPPPHTHSLSPHLTFPFSVQFSLAITVTAKGVVGTTMDAATVVATVGSWVASVARGRSALTAGETTVEQVVKEYPIAQIGLS